MTDGSVLLGRRQRFGLASRRKYLVIDLRKVNHASPHRLDLRIHPYAQHVGSTNWLRFSFVGGKQKKSRKFRSPTCRAQGSNIRHQTNRTKWQ